ncbi:MAG: glutaredoxin family protein [Actinomycetota bacterium]
MRLTLLTQDDCAFCDQAKAILNRLSTEFGFSVRVLDIDSPEGERLAAEGGIMFPPGLLIDDEPVSYGRPSERKLRRALERRMRSARSEMR